MSLEQAFKRLALSPSPMCQQCRRTFTSTPRGLQPPRSATVSFADSLINPRQEATSTQPRALSSRTLSADDPVAPPTPKSTPAPAPVTRSPYDIAQGAIRDATASARARNLAEAVRSFSRKDLEQQIARRWKPGDIYAPHDLSGMEMAKWKKIRRKPKPKFDVLDQLGINPLHHYKNFSIMSEYITEMGRIRHSNDTGLRPVNQRKMAKAIRRAMGLGLMPGVHRHPELLKMEMRAENQR